MIAVLKRELNQYFISPIAYVFIAAYTLLAGYFFFNYNLYSNTTDMRSVFEYMFTVTIFIIPVLTMRLMSEDRRNKTDQLLRMCPITAGEIVVGKYFAALITYFISLLIFPIMALVMSFSAAVEWPVIIGNFIGLLLLGATLISTGLFVSSLTENQIIAAIGGFCIAFFLLLLDSLSNIVSNVTFSNFLNKISFQTHYRGFTLGVLSFANILFFISISAFFVYLTALVFEQRRFN